MTRTDGSVKALAVTRTLLLAACVIMAGCSRNPAPASKQQAASEQNAQPRTRAEIAASLNDQLAHEFPDTLQPLNGVVSLYDDSLTNGKTELVRTTMPLAVLSKRINIADTSNVVLAYPVVFRVRILGTQRQDIIGWVKARDVIVSKKNFTSDFSVLEGPVGYCYNEPSGSYIPYNYLWLKTGRGIIAIPGSSIAQTWFKPDSQMVMVLRGGFDDEQRTLIFDREGTIVFQMSKMCTTPAWHGSICLVRGMYDDDAVYAIDLKKKTCAIFFKIPDQYEKRRPDYGSGDGYYEHPAAAVDPKTKTVSIRFDRHKSDGTTNGADIRSYLLATTDLNGRLIMIEEKSDPE